jgi:hypothetical protein
MRQLLGQAKSLVASPESCLGIAKMPQGPGCIGETSHSRISPPVKGSMDLVSLRIIEGNALL